MSFWDLPVKLLDSNLPSYSLFTVYAIFLGETFFFSEWGKLLTARLIKLSSDYFSSYFFSSRIQPLCSLSWIAD